MFIGTMGFFTFLMFMFVKVLPMINVFEMRELLFRYFESGQKSDPVLQEKEAKQPATIGKGA